MYESFTFGGGFGFLKGNCEGYRALCYFWRWGFSVNRTLGGGAYFGRWNYSLAGEILTLGGEILTFGNEMPYFWQ